MAKDSFGYGTTTGVVEWGDEISKEHQIEPEVIEAVQKDFGDKFGSDLSLLVLEHYKATGDLILGDRITPNVVDVLKDKYMNNIFEAK